MGGDLQSWRESTDNDHENNPEPDDKNSAPLALQSIYVTPA
jgi:hypothetical protein